MSRLLDKTLKEMRVYLENEIAWHPKVLSFQKLVNEEYTSVGRAVGAVMSGLSYSQQLHLVEELDARIWEMRVDVGPTYIKQVVYLVLRMYFEKQLISEFGIPQRAWK